MTRRIPHSPESESNGAVGERESAPVRVEEAPRTTGVRYGSMNWIGEFRLPAKVDIDYGAKVVIQSDRGIEIGEQVGLTCPDHPCAVKAEQVKHYVDVSGGEFYRLRAGRILRPASPQDLAEHVHLNSHVREDVAECARLAREAGLKMKVITAEHLLGGERIVFYFRSEGRIDFRELVRALAQHYQTRIEMRQVGARDEARLIADYEVCGRECCCKNFLKKLRPVTMRMAKLQKSTLDPSKVSGRCGRLRCCLRYEHEGYDELLNNLPRLGTRVETASGPGKVVDRQVLTQLVLVRCDDGREVAVPVDETAPAGTPPPGAPPKIPEAPPAPPPEAEAKEAAPDDDAEKRPRRRRRRRRKTNGEAGGQPTPSDGARPAQPGPATSEPTKDERGARPPAPAQTSDANAAGASGDDKAAPAGDEQRRSRRRRRRRRPRRGPSDSAPGVDNSA
jgi:cell fate regulator YaaT (PSP1 superfamily)